MTLLNTARGIPLNNLRRLAFYPAAIYSLVLLVATGLVSGWSEWFSFNPAHRAQTEALLQGRLALSGSPSALRHDMVWSKGGVHQVWGLGIPLWRLPFEAGARLCGQPAFPDRLAFGLFSAVVAYLVLISWVLVSSHHDLGETSGIPPPLSACLPVQCGACLVLLLFPPFITLLRVRLDVYEEVLAYTYLYGIGLISLLMVFASRPTLPRWLWLCVLAGLGGLFRPTLVCYGFATLVVGGVVYWRARSRIGTPRHRSMIAPIAVGLALFCGGGGLLYATNLARFGNGFEFGHRLNMQDLYGSLYATRIENPFAREPAASTARELLGALFLSRSSFNDMHWHQPGFFAGQSGTPRWREFYFTTFDLTFVPLLLLGWGAGLRGVWRWWRRQRNTTEPAPVVPVLALWSMIGGVPLLWLYLWSPALASRYFIDLAPAFAVVISGGWFAVCSWVRSERARWGLLVVLAAWLALEIGTAQKSPTYSWSTSVAWSDLRPWPAESGTKVSLPDAEYRLGEDLKASGIPYNGQGWNPVTGGVMPVIILFVEAPQFLELEVEATGGDSSGVNPEVIRAKMGLEFLERRNIERTATGWKARFDIPEQVRNRKGIQAAFVAFVSPGHLADGSTPWRLKAVRWRKAPDSGRGVRGVE